MNLVLSFRWHRDYHGRPGAEDANEWPPSPWRLFCALLAAQAPETPADVSPSLLWLSALPSPVILTPPTGESVLMPRHSVPLNDLDAPARDPFRESDIARLRLIKFRRDVCLPLRGTREVWFAWQADEAEAKAHLESLDQLMSKVPYLGNSQDTGTGRAWLQGPEAMDPGDRARWEPAASPGVHLPTATPEVLRALVDFHCRQEKQTRRFAEVAPPRVYYRRQDDPQALQVIFRFEERNGTLAAFSALESCALAECFRACLLKAASNVGTVPDFIHGHHANNREHVFIVPLPTIGHRHADGLIRRVMIFGTPPEEERPDTDSVLRELAFSMMTFGGRQFVLTPEDALSGVARSYLGESSSWQTVTPVVLPNPELRGRESERWKHRKSLGHVERQELQDILQERRVAMVRRMVVRCGFTPTRVAVSEQPSAGGEFAAGRFVVPETRKKYLSTTRCHVALDLAEPVSGPILLGRGKNFGLGLFAPTRVLQQQGSPEGVLAG